MTASAPTKPLQTAGPPTRPRAHECQAFGSLVPMPIALGEHARREGVADLNQLLADTLTLRDLYKKHHWQASGATFYPLHLLFDKHAGEQCGLIDAVAERVMKLGGVSVAMAADVAEMTLIPRPPKGREEVSAQLARLLHAHEVVLEEARAMARRAAAAGDDGTSDLLVGDVIRTNETQVWFLAGSLTAQPPAHADGVPGR
ncbi:MAG: polymerase [Gemmataceae bacterium]|nr:polymerase [Gemmataceae bacterium]